MGNLREFNAAHNAADTASVTEDGESFAPQATHAGIGFSIFNIASADEKPPKEEKKAPGTPYTRHVYANRSSQAPARDVSISNPMGEYRGLPSKLKLEPDFQPQTTAPLVPIVIDKSARRFSLADAMNVPAAAFVAPIEDEEQAVNAANNKPGLQPLTPDYLEQLVHWYREHNSGRLPAVSSKAPVWIKEGNEWVESAQTWGFVVKALINGTHGIEQTFPSLADFVDSRKPPLTADYLVSLLAWTSEKIGSKVITFDTPVWTKIDLPSGEQEWKPSLYRFLQIDVLMKTPGYRSQFKNMGLTDFKAALGYFSGKSAPKPSTDNSPSWQINPK